MKGITIHVVRAGNIASVPPLRLDAKPLERWFSDASGGELVLTSRSSVSTLAPDLCDGGTLDEMLREEIPFPEKRPVSDVAVIFCTRWKVPEEAGDLKLFG